jgi:flavin-dependent dehydrogenase
MMDYDVAIIGGGPAGLATLSALLHPRGVLSETAQEQGH